MKDIYFFLRRIFFTAAVLLAGAAAIEKILNMTGYTVLGDSYTPWRLIEFSAIILLFVIVLQLKEINATLSKKAPKEERKLQD